MGGGYVVGTHFEDVACEGESEMSEMMDQMVLYDSYLTRILVLIMQPCCLGCQILARFSSHKQ